MTDKYSYLRKALDNVEKGLNLAHDGRHSFFIADEVKSLLTERDALRETLETIEAMHNYEQSVGEAASALYEASNMARYVLKKEY